MTFKATLSGAKDMGPCYIIIEDAVSLEAADAIAQDHFRNRFECGDVLVVECIGE